MFDIKRKFLLALGFVGLFWLLMVGVFLVAYGAYQQSLFSLMLASIIMALEFVLISLLAEWY